MTPCKLVQPVYRTDFPEHLDFDKHSPGDMFFLDYPEERLKGMHLSEHYWIHNAHRRKPLVVMLPRKVGPGLLYFVIDGMCYDGPRGYYGGWSVQGDPPAITVSPSINYGSGDSGYHGFLQNGILTAPL